MLLLLVFTGSARRSRPTARFLGGWRVYRASLVRITAGRGQERSAARRQRRYFVGVERTDKPRGDENHELGPLSSLRPGLEQVSDDRDLAQERDRRAIFLRNVVEQSGHRERLSVAQLDVRLGAPRDQRRDSKATKRDAVREVQRAHFGGNFQADDVARDARREGQANSEFLVLHGDRAVA